MTADDVTEVGDYVTDRAAALIEPFLPSMPDQASSLIAHRMATALAKDGLLQDTRWEVAECDDEVDDGRCHDEMHANFEVEKLKSVRTEVRTGVYEYRDLRPRRLVGPWVWPK